MTGQQAMRDYCAVYAVDFDAVAMSRAERRQAEPFVRFFKADDLQHAYEQAMDGTEDGERLVCVADGPVRTFCAYDLESDGVRG